MNLETLGALILGWLLGLLSPTIVSAIEKRRREDEVRAGILTELRDVRMRLASAVVVLERRHGTFDRALVQWLIPILETGTDSEEREELEFYREMATLDDAVLLAMIQEERAGRQLGLNLKKYRLPYLESKFGELGLFDEKTRAAILDGRAQVELFNADVDQALMYQKMTFEVEDPDNRSRVLRNVENFSKGLAKKGRHIADRIGRITTGEAGQRNCPGRQTT